MPSAENSGVDHGSHSCVMPGREFLKLTRKSPLKCGFLFSMEAIFQGCLFLLIFMDALPRGADAEVW